MASLQNNFEEVQIELWDARDPEEIDQFISTDYNSKVKPLNEADKKKIANLDVLRGLNTKLAKIRNNVKLTKDQISQETRLIEDQIKEIVEGDEEEKAECSSEFNLEDLIYKIACRGPNFLGYRQFQHQSFNFQMFSSVLSLRQPFQPQPLQLEDKILQFNGELYNEECQDSNDTTYIMNLLKHSDSTPDAILNTFCQLQGEFAFVLVDLRSNLVYFGRDSVGKRSLLFRHLHQELLVTSTAEMESQSFMECKNEISIYDMSKHSIIHHSYADLHEKYSLPSLNYKPLVYNPEASIDKSLEGLYKIIKSKTLVRQQLIHPLTEEDSALAVLFSGGLDCTVLAALICENIIERKPSKLVNIDLLTVGFDNPRTNQRASASPDRMLGKKSWYNLAAKYNGEYLKLRLVEIDISYEQWLTHKHRVRDLMYPSNTEMDLSIAIAFYFASSTLPQSTKLLEKPDTCTMSYEEFILKESQLLQITPEYKSAAKVLFSGLGADELFAGYSRHESIFTNNITETSSREDIELRYNELSKELINDIAIIHKRNLGRDDRVIGCWGKELRYPYLDEELISYVINEIEPNSKLHFGFETITTKKKGSKTVLKATRKYLLRELAGYLGLEWVKSELKRAIQFGAKSAKLEIGQSKAKGTDNL
ncbi:uncharacterized protein CANTADRAFT_94302 [Suhomyces tanzawaensis NRRL Y-17324]|uniref:Glutamine amidotransferase type-2 domain-containing protein n=1 Tax=Suhomyces tanzawaensis NRRL Y-17324 TaxID=984487 RepID=A0A1E4SNR6_9ASCO|nr:uncharacterized protein CANTADRAFT_94302 [Suhomyces tanzawaensis NRRL Y-17324]ODV81164.1 hypothetical protein CANTADRAFT_94302 [Suhomyces tanzawaensis NRRL Y-17324]